jgi:hypothetical protein
MTDKSANDADYVSPNKILQLSTGAEMEKQPECAIRVNASIKTAKNIHWRSWPLSLQVNCSSQFASPVVVIV